MPVARGPQMNARSAVVVGLTGVAIAIVLGGGVLLLASRGGDVEIQLGDTDFDAGQIGRISEEIDDRGPILYSDVAGRSRDLILQHIGDDPAAGWLAFNARPLGEPRGAAHRSPGGVYHRAFASGTEVWLDSKDETASAWGSSCIKWADGHITHGGRDCRAPD